MWVNRWLVRLAEVVQEDMRFGKRDFVAIIPQPDCYDTMSRHPWIQRKVVESLHLLNVRLPILFIKLVCSKAVDRIGQMEKNIAVVKI